MGAILRPFPNVLQPRGQIKPYGVPRIDWTHPLTFGLLCYWFDTGTGVVVDLVNGRIATKPSNMAVVSKGAAPYGAGNSYSIAAGCVADPLAAANQALAAPYSIASAIIPLGASLGTSPAYFGLFDGSGNDCVLVYAPTTTTIGIGFGNSSSPSNFTYTVNKFYVIVGSATGLSAQSWWVNGVAQTAGTGTSLFSGSGQHYVLGGTNQFNVSGTGAPNAYVYFGATWQGRALTQQDAVLLYTDPYCFLLPQEGEMPALFVAGGVTAFTMNASTGNYTLAGENLKLLKTSIENIQSGAYALTGEQVAAKKGSKVTAQSGSYLLTGEQITALKKSIDNLQSGTYVTSSQPVLKKTSKQNIQEVPYALTDETLTTKKGYADFPQAGNYALTGEQIKELKTSLDTLQAGTYATSSQPVLKKTSLLNSGVGLYTIGDPVNFLLHCDGTNGSTTFLDASSYQNAVVGNSGVTVDTSTFIFGTGSASFDGISGFLNIWNGTASLGPFDPGTGDFTIDFWFKTSNTGTNYFLDYGDGSSGIVSPNIYVFNSHMFWDLNLAGGKIIGTKNISDNAWHHFAVARQGTATKMFIDGIQDGSTYTGSENLGATLSAEVNIGASTNEGNLYTGHIDEFRIVIGRAQWTSNFTPPSEPYRVQTAKLLKGSKDTPQAGFYALAGEQVTLKATHLQAVQTVFYSFTGEQITIIPPTTGFTISIGTGNYTLTDENLTLLKTSKQGIQVATYSLTDEALTLLKASKLFESSGTYALTDEQLTLKASRQLNAQSGPYNLTDEQLTLLRKALAKGQTGFYNLTGENLTLKKASTAFQQAGFYNLTDEQLVLKAARLAQLQTGFYSLVGGSLSLSVPGQFFMTITTGTYALTVEQETLLKTSRATVQSAVYVFTGETEKTLKGSAAFPQVGLYALTPEQLKEIKTSRMGAQTVTYSFTVENEQLAKGYRAGIQTGSYTLTGEQISDMIGSFSMSLGAGSYLLTGEALPITTTATVITLVATPILFGDENGQMLSGVNANAGLFGIKSTPGLKGDEG